MLELRRFGKYDWDAWAGASRFDDGGLPLIGEMTLLNNDTLAPEDTVCIIIDKDQMTLVYGDGEYDSYVTGINAINVLARLNSRMKMAEFETALLLSHLKAPWMEAV